MWVYLLSNFMTRDYAILLLVMDRLSTSVNHSRVSSAKYFLYEYLEFFMSTYNQDMEVSARKFRIE